MKKVFIDAGHNYNGVDTGALGHGYREQDISFAISEKLKSYLEQQGILVQMSRNSLKENVSTVSVNDSLMKRAEMANQFQADLFISIHCNSGGGQGVETYCFSASSSAYKLAQTVQNALVQAVQRPNRGVKCANFLVLRNTKMPAVLVETGFIDSDKDIVLLSDKNGQHAIAQAIAKGVCEYLRIPFKANSSPVKTATIDISETYTVSADLLQARSEPAVSAPVVGQFVKGDIVYSHARYGDWNKCLLWNGSYGWVERKYLTLKSNYSGNLNAAKVFVVTADLLNVRSLPSTDSPIIGALVKGDKVYTNVQKNGWYQIQMWDGSYGWICGDYLSECIERAEATGMKYKKQNNVHIITCDSKRFGISARTNKKLNYGIKNYYNLGFFAQTADGKTYPASNLADSGIVFAQSKLFPSWINTAQKELTTICVLADGNILSKKTSDLSSISNLKTAVSGIPIILDGTNTTMDTIRSEGYFGNELYDTWHGFLTYQGQEIVYFAAKAGTLREMQCLVREIGYGNNTVIKLDGGGSFVLCIDGEIIEKTDENRKIDSIGMFE